jgi:hypothetical protein
MVSGASYPSDVSAVVTDKLCEYSETISEKLGLTDGILHIQYILSEDGTPYIIEICRRSPGDLYIRFVEIAAGVPYPDMIIEAETGSDITVVSDKKTGYYTRHCVMSDHRGTIESVVYSDKIKDNIIESLMWWKKGDVIENELLYKAGIVFLRFENKQEMEQKLPFINELIKIRLR